MPGHFLAGTISSHGLVFKADTAHLLVQSVSGRIIVHGERQMELVFTQVVGFGAVRQPCQLQLVGRDAVAQVNEGERISGVAPHLPQARRSGWYTKINESGAQNISRFAPLRAKMHDAEQTRHNTELF